MMAIDFRPQPQENASVLLPKSGNAVVLPNNTAPFRNVQNRSCCELAVVARIV